MTITKAQAVELFQRFHLDGLPAFLLHLPSPDPVDAIRTQLPNASRFTLRVCGNDENQNLPRIIGCDLGDAEQWLNEAHGDGVSTVVVQPYDDLLFSVELAVAEHTYVAELVPGIWELDNQAEPTTMTLTPAEESCVRLRGPVAAQPAKYWMISTGYVVQQARVEDWQLSDVMRWVGENASELQQLRDAVGTDVVGVKLHYARRYGLSPQNIHTKGLSVPADVQPTAPMHLPILTSVQQAPPQTTAVRLAVSIGRERYSDLLAFVATLQAAGVKTVYVRSGLLSHMAITLRQHGFEVRRW
ncbi:hypothetical protein OHA40_32230 [Nocardia sp. NBC_00508]|uniref:hypothetical protein n=1 Tax=Nocardia sp. NBC_00508 TaxID=2975992 RepID=UPI002E800831|nr:hypothetical protein [Nocardia sp. NBC_00508]WUD66174.1 hypothetical protein OHA40_32230 [Nocardia sp. NBC_00508]